jgi:hypothetical protein
VAAAAAAGQQQAEDLLAMAKARAEQARADVRRLEAAQAQQPLPMGPPNVPMAPIRGFVNPALANVNNWPREFRKLWVGNLPGNVTEQAIGDICLRAGVDLEEVHLHAMTATSGMRSATLLTPNPAMCLRTLVKELHGHLPYT